MQRKISSLFIDFVNESWRFKKKKLKYEAHKVNIFYQRRKVWGLKLNIKKKRRRRQFLLNTGWRT